MAEKDIELFERAYRGELLPEQEETFNHRIESDSDFRLRYEKFGRLVNNIRQQKRYEELMVLLNENYKSRDWSTDAVSDHRAKYQLLALIAVVAVIVGVVVLVWNLNKNGSQVIQTEEPRVAESYSEQESVLVDAEADVDPSVATSEEQVDETAASGSNPTAFMISQKGYFITQYSPLREAKFFRLRQNDSTEYRAEIVLQDQGLDVAVLRLTDAWNSENRLPYRLATTQAYQNTEIMATARKGGKMVYTEGLITALNKDGVFDYYAVELADAEALSGGPVISKNGNVVAILVATDEGVQIVKSTYLVGLLAQNASDPRLADYLPETNNRLAGVERVEQLQRLEPFVLEVIRFY